MENENIGNEQQEHYRIYKLVSANTDYFYIDFTKNKSYMTMVLHGLINRYHKNGNCRSKYKDYFYIISKNNISIEELKKCDTFEEMEIVIANYKNDPKCINGKKMDDYIFNDDKTLYTKRDKVDKYAYLKKYYAKNKDKYHDRYLKNRETILQKKRDTYVSKKKKMPADDDN